MAKEILTDILVHSSGATNSKKQENEKKNTNNNDKAQERTRSEECRNAAMHFDRNKK